MRIVLNIILIIGFILHAIGAEIVPCIYIFTTIIWMNRYYDKKY